MVLKIINIYKTKLTCAVLLDEGGKTTRVKHSTLKNEYLRYNSTQTEFKEKKKVKPSTWKPKKVVTHIHLAFIDEVIVFLLSIVWLWFVLSLFNKYQY